MVGGAEGLPSRDSRRARVLVLCNDFDFNESEMALL